MEKIKNNSPASIISGELHQQVGSKYAVFCYSGMNINDPLNNVSVCLYVVLLKTQTPYVSKKFQKGTHIITRYKANRKEYELMGSKLYFQYYMHNHFEASKDLFGTTFADYSDKRASELMQYIDLPFEKGDIVKEFAFFEGIYMEWLETEGDWFEFSAKVRNLLCEIDLKERKSISQTTLFRRYYATLTPIIDTWLARGKVLNRNLKAFIFNTGFFEENPSIQCYLFYRRTVNVYDTKDDLVYVFKFSTEFPQLTRDDYIIEKKNGRKLVYSTKNKQYIIRRLVYDINGSDIEKIEKEVIAFIPKHRVAAETIRCLSLHNIKNIDFIQRDDSYMFSTERNNPNKNFVNIQNLRDMKEGFCISTEKDSFVLLGYEQIEEFRRKGILLKVNNDIDFVQRIKHQQAARALMNQSFTFYDIKPIIDERWVLYDLRYSFLPKSDLWNLNFK